MLNCALIEDLGLWNRVLEGQASLLRSVAQGGRIGLIPKQELEAAEQKMVVWEIESGKATAGHRPFRGFRDTEVDVIFVADQEALGRLRQDSSLPEFRTLIRHGNIIFYVMKRRDELFAKGYEDLLEALGIPFMGGCH